MSLARGRLFQTVVVLTLPAVILALSVTSHQLVAAFAVAAFLLYGSWVTLAGRNERGAHLHRWYHSLADRDPGNAWYNRRWRPTPSQAVGVAVFLGVFESAMAIVMVAYAFFVDR